MLQCSDSGVSRDAIFVSTWPSGGYIYMEAGQ